MLRSTLGNKLNCQPMRLPRLPFTLVSNIRLQANGTSYPSPTSFARKLSLDKPDEPYNLSLCPSQGSRSQEAAIGNLAAWFRDTYLQRSACCTP